jgi:hypothetical protein
MAKKNTTEKSFEDYKEELMQGDEQARSIDDWEALGNEIRKAKSLTDGDKDRLIVAIQYRIKEKQDEAKEQAEAEPEPVIINDGLPKASHKKVMAVSSKTEHTKVLGYIAGTTVGASQIPNDVVLDFFRKRNMPEHMIPKVAKPLDAFSRACQTLKRDEVKVIEKGQVQCSWNINNLDARTYMITRRILIQDENGKRDLGWQNIARCVLEGEGNDPKANKIVIQPVGEQKGQKTLCEAIQKEVREVYQTYLDNIMDKQVRDALRNTIYAVNGIGFTMGRGGAYFIPIQAQSIIEVWRDFASMVNARYTLGGFPVAIRLIPLADVDEYREMVIEDVQKEVGERMEALLKSTLDALEKAQSRAKDGNISDDTLDKMLARKLEEQASTIELLEDYKTMLGVNIRVSLDKLDTMLNEVAVPISERHQMALRRLASFEAASAQKKEEGKPKAKKGKGKKAQSQTE